MVRRLALLFLAVIFGMAALAQDSRGGTGAINTMLQTPLDAAKNHPGDPVLANVLVDMVIGTRVAIPKGSLFTGKIVSLTPKSKTSKESTIEIEFESLKFADGQVFPIAATVQALLVKAPPADEGTVGGGAPTRAMSGTNNGGVTSDIENGDRERGATVAENSENYSLGRIMPANASGVHGVKNVSLKTHDDVSVISSSKRDIKIDSGSQLLLLVRNR